MLGGVHCDVINEYVPLDELPDRLPTTETLNSYRATSWAPLPTYTNVATKIPTKLMLSCDARMVYTFCMNLCLIF